MKLPIGEQLTRTYIILYVRFCKSGGGSRNPLERWGISFSTPTFGFSTFVESIPKRLRNVDEFAQYRSTSRILLFFPHFRSPTFDLSFPLRMQVKRVPAPFVVGISTRPRAHGRRETGWAISFRGRESCSTRRRPVPNIFQVCMALSTIRYFNIDTLSVFTGRRERLGEQSVHICTSFTLGDCTRLSFHNDRRRNVQREEGRALTSTSYDFDNIVETRPREPC